MSTSGLTSLERRALHAIADAVVPPGGAVPEGAADVGVADEIAGWVAGWSSGPRRLVRAMLVGFELTPLLSRHPRLFHQLDEEARRDWVDGSGHARFKPRAAALEGLRTLVQIAYASDARVQKVIGWDGSPLLPLDDAARTRGPKLPVRHWPELRPGDLEADVVIVGTGAGGAVAADRLSRAGLRVVLLEEGGLHDRDEFSERRPVDRLLDVYRDHGLTNTIGAPVISLPMGKAVGGTTVVNSGTCFRTPDDVLHAWSHDGIPDVDPEAMAPWFDEVEDVLGVQPVPDEVLGNNGSVFARGASELGYSGGPIRRNIRSCHGHGVCAFGCHIDAKQAMHVTYLPRAVGAGAEILAHVRAEKVWLEDGRAVGAIGQVIDPETGKSRGRLRVRARHTIVAAGAIYTPALLMRQRMARTSGQLGRNLVIHPGAGTTARFDEDLGAWRGTMQSWYVDEKLADGVLLEATFPPPGVGYSAGSLPGWGRDKELFRLYPHMASCGSIVSDAGVGRVRPLGRRGVLIRYDLTRDDARKVIEGIALSAEIYFAAGARTVYPMLPGLPEITSPREVAQLREGRWSRAQLHLSAYHPMGTARMGADPARSVVDPWGAVWDVPGLSVLDGSVLPSSTHVNPQITIMALVARSAHRLADSLT